MTDARAGKLTQQLHTNNKQPINAPQQQHRKHS